MICKLKLGRGEIAKTWEILTGTPPDLVSTSYPYGAHRFTLRCCAHNFKWCAHLAFRMELVYSNKPSNEINKNNKIGYRDRIQKRDRGGGLGSHFFSLLSPTTPLVTSEAPISTKLDRPVGCRFKYPPSPASGLFLPRSIKISSLALPSSIAAAVYFHWR